MNETQRNLIDVPREEGPAWFLLLHCHPLYSLFFCCFHLKWNWICVNDFLQVQQSRSENMLNCESHLTSEVSIITPIEKALTANRAKFSLNFMLQFCLDQGKEVNIQCSPDSSKCTCSPSCTKARCQHQRRVVHFPGEVTTSISVHQPHLLRDHFTDICFMLAVTR